jgi:flagellar hook-associated protein FlgK
MPDLVTMGANAAQIYRVALSTVSNNIANVGNDIYSRQQTILSAGAPAKVGVVNIGTGANLDYIYRSYNEFIESSLRNSSSAVKTQETLINYTDRIVDIMGSDEGNLINALDGFYSSLNRLEMDAANIGIRNELLSSGKYLASRINELATEVQNIREDSQGELEKNIVSINKVAEALFNVNQELNRNDSLKLQSPSMLDQRDNLLSQLADYVDINVTENENGTVIVRVSGPANKSILVDTVRQRQLGMQRHSINGNVQGLVVDTYSNPTFVGIPSSGVISGLIQLDNEVTQRLTDELNIFAKTFVDTMNVYHRAGLDLTNNLGDDMFKIAPNFLVTNLGDVVDNSFTVSGSPSGEVNPFSITAIDSSTWIVRDLMTDKVVQAKAVDVEGGKSLSYMGLSILLPAAISEGAVYKVVREKEPAQEVVFNIDDPRKIAAAARLHVQGNPNNSNNIEVSVDYSGSRAEEPSIRGLDIGGIQNKNLTKTLSPSSTIPALSVPPNFGDFSISVMSGLDSPLNLQIFNNDFVKLAGTGEFTAAELTSLSDSGLYGTKQYIDASGTDFPGKDIYIGSKSNLELITERAASQIDGATIANGALELNGVALTALTMAQNEKNHPAEVANWINTNAVGDITARAENKIKVFPGTIKYTAIPALQINGFEINQAIDLKDLVNQINEQSSDTGARAYLDHEKNLIITNNFGEEGKSIEISGAVLGITQTTYTGQVIFNSDGEISFTLGANGSSVDLARIGLATTISGSNKTGSSLHLFAKSENTIDAQVRVGVMLAEPTKEVEPPFSVEFFDDGDGLYYKIKDTTLDVVVYQKGFSSGDDIIFKQLAMSFDLDPQAGDKFVFTKNTDAFGDNANLRLISATENEELYNGYNARTYYTNQVNRIGAVSDLAKLNKDAAEILYDENRVKKSAMSGVNLDQEAAELMRYQQAFQASAQLIQVSSRLFEAIINAG